jgi:hypothetical protein
MLIGWQRMTSASHSSRAAAAFSTRLPLKERLPSQPIVQLMDLTEPRNRGWGWSTVVLLDDRIRCEQSRFGSAGNAESTADGMPAVGTVRPCGHGPL